MSRESYILLAGLFFLGAGTSHAVVADDDDDTETTYDVDFYNGAGDSGTVYLDGNAICNLEMKQSCSQTLAKAGGRHTAVFRATAGYQVSETFDAGTCGQYPGASVNFDIYDDRVEITCNGLSF